MWNTNVIEGGRHECEEVDEEKQSFPDIDTLHGLVLAQLQRATMSASGLQTLRFAQRRS